MNRGRAIAVLALLLALAAVWGVCVRRSETPPRAVAPQDAGALASSAPAPSDAVIRRADVVALQNHSVIIPVPSVVPSVVLRGRWGSGDGEFGHTTEAEANPEGPMALSVGPGGELAVLDQRNRRILRVGASGRATVAIEGDTVQDLAHGPEGRLVALDRLGAAAVTVYDRAGALAATIPLRGGPIAEGGAVTGVFADDRGIYVEREHREVVRVADASGREDPARPILWGRPSRDGEQLLRAAMEDRARGAVRVTVAARENGAVDWSTVVPMGGAIVHLAMLDSDASGRVYVAAVVGTFTPDGVRDPALAVARLDRAGVVDGTLRLPAWSVGDELFRPMCVDDAGAVYVMVPGRDGLTVERHTFPG